MCDIKNLIINLSIIISSQQRWKGYSNAAVRDLPWLGEWVDGYVCPLRFTFGAW